MPASDPPTPLEQVALLELELAASRQELATLRAALATDPQRLGETLQHAQQDASVSVLVAAVAQDLDSLLLSVLGNTGLVLRELEPGSPLRPWVESVESAAQRASELARHLASWTDGAASGPRTGDLGEPVADAVSLPPASRLAHGPSGVRAALDTIPERGLLLVVEDEDGVRATLRLALEYAGFEVIGARDGRTAVELFEARSEAFVAIVLDLSLPEWSGAEVLRRIRALRPEVPVFVTSGYSEEDHSESLAGLAVTGFFEKPYSLEALTTGIIAVAGARAARTG